MTDHYAHAIAKFLAGNARQVVPLVGRHQWNLVKEITEPITISIRSFLDSWSRELVGLDFLT